MSTHPNSLKNLKPFFNTEEAKSAQKKSVIARKANAAAREKLKMSMRDWKEFKKTVVEEADMSSIDVLKILMHKALSEDDFDTAAELAKSLAEFESPKLARIDQTTTELSVEELSDEELDSKIVELGLVR
jgi:hypothetical protein|tara:strand:- start:770 stop:1159 length:390 start_codon:yes stop_codon:yes gene_type:complete